MFKQTEAKKPRGEYHIYTAKERAEIGKRAAVYVITLTIRYYRKNSSQRPVAFALFYRCLEWNPGRPNGTELPSHPEQENRLAPLTTHDILPPLRKNKWHGVEMFLGKCPTTIYLLDRELLPRRTYRVCFHAPSYNVTALLC